MLGLYLHIPFCSSICNYCNFNRGLFEAGLKDRYVDALEQEIRAAGRGEPADTIFFGGGTPSLLEPVEIGRLIEACRRRSTSRADAEVTLETNPETSSRRADGRISRAPASIGSVSVSNPSGTTSSKRLGRMHSAPRARGRGRRGAARRGSTTSAST